MSWFEDMPTVSLALINDAKASPHSVIDIGGDDVTVLDLSAIALDVAKAQLGEAAGKVDWIVADITRQRWRGFAG